MAASEIPSVAEACELLPGWVIWGGDAVFVGLSLLIAVPAAWLAVRFALRPWTRAANAHWTEQARLSYPPRLVLYRAGVLLPPLIVTWGLLTRTDLTPLPRVWLSLSVAAVVAMGMVALHCRLERRLGDIQLTFVEALRSVATRALLFGPHLIVALGAAAFIPDDFGMATFAALALVGLATIVLAFGGNLSLLRVLGLARTAGPQLQGIGRRVAGAMGVRLRDVDEIDWAAVNALAFPGTRSIAFTPRCAALLADEQIAAICGHELGHLREPAAALMARMVTALFVALWIASIRPVVVTFGPLGLLAGFLGFLVVSRAFVAFSQRMEQRADAAARENESAEGAFARALERLYELNLIPAVMFVKARLHPDLYDRLVAAGIEPVYPRPAPPSRARSLGALVVLFIPLACVAAGNVAVVDAVTDAPPDNETMQKLAFALQIAPAQSLANLGTIRMNQGKLAGAIVMLRAATDLGPLSSSYPLQLARAYLADGGLDAAAAAIALARQRSAAAGRPPDLALEQVAQSIDARRGIRQRPAGAQVPWPANEPAAEPAGAEPQQGGPGIAPGADQPPDEGRPWRRRGRGRGRGRWRPPMA